MPVSSFKRKLASRLFDNREDVVTVECCDCKVRQGVNENCINCGLKFGQVVRLQILSF